MELSILQAKLATPEAQAMLAERARAFDESGGVKGLFADLFTWDPVGAGIAESISAMTTQVFDGFRFGAITDLIDWNWKPNPLPDIAPLRPTLPPLRVQPMARIEIVIRDERTKHEDGEGE